VNEDPLLITEERKQIPIKISTRKQRQQQQSPLRITEEVKTMTAKAPIKFKIGILQRGKK